MRWMEWGMMMLKWKWWRDWWNNEMEWMTDRRKWMEMNEWELRCTVPKGLGESHCVVTHHQTQSQNGHQIILRTCEYLIFQTYPTWGSWAAAQLLSSQVGVPKRSEALSPRFHSASIPPAGMEMSIPYNKWAVLNRTPSVLCEWAAFLMSKVIFLSAALRAAGSLTVAQ